MKICPRIIEITSDRLSVRAGRKQRAIVERELVRPAINPVVKWAGGKQWLAPAARHLLPQGFAARYYEPFFGGGAFFFAVEPALATLSDRNEALMSTYRTLRNDTEGVIQLLSRYPH